MKSVTKAASHVMNKRHKMHQPENENPSRKSWTVKKLLAQPGISQDFREQLTQSVAELDRVRQVVREFVLGAVTGNCELMEARFEELALGSCEPGGGWIGVMRSVSRLPSVPPTTQDFFLEHFIESGNFLRQQCSAVILADGLRVLLPKYSGPAMRLYRGERFENRRWRAYGLSWSITADAALCHAEKIETRSHPGGSVLLETMAPADAIISRIPASKDHYREEEYVVDRRRLTSVKVIQRFAQMKVKTREKG